MLYVILVMLFALLGFVHGMNRADNRKCFHNSVRYNSKQRAIRRADHMA